MIPRRSEKEKRWGSGGRQIEILLLHISGGFGYASGGMA